MLLKIAQNPQVMQGASRRLSCHEGVRCNACARANFRGKRYKCLICYDYDLCERCFEEEVTDSAHKAEHAVQCILTQVDYDLYYGGEAAEQPQSFTCPMCATMGFTTAGLREHVTAEHTETEVPVVCPVCAATPGGNSNNVTADLAVHLALEHARSRDILDDESASRRLHRASPAVVRGGIGSSVRGRRPLRQLPSAMVSAPPLSPPDTSSTGTISGLLSQISTGARRTSMLLEPRGSATEVQQLRTRLQATRQQIQTAFLSQDRPRLRDPLPAATAVSPPLTRFAEPPAADPKPVLVPPPPPDDARFLLVARAEPALDDSQQRAIEVERADRSLFVQELLLSTLEPQTAPDAGGKRCESKDASGAMRGAVEAPTAGTNPNATTGLQPREQAAPMRSNSNSTTRPEPIVTSNRETCVVAALEPTPPSRLDPTPATCLGLTVTTSVQPTDPKISGLTSVASPEPTIPNSPRSTATTSCGHTDAASSIHTAASPGHTEAASGSPTALSS